MHYVCLVYCEESRLHSLPESPSDHECAEFSEGLTESGHMLGGNALEPVETAITVRVRSGRLTVTDGPFTETKEQLAGFYLIEARDLNEAIQIAGRIPPARVGSIEVRPVRTLQPEPVPPGAEAHRSAMGRNGPVPSGGGGGREY